MLIRPAIQHPIGDLTAPLARGVVPMVSTNDPDFQYCVGAFYFCEGSGAPVNLINRHPTTFLGTGATWAAQGDTVGIDFQGTGASRLDLGVIVPTNPLNCAATNECTVIARVKYETPANSFPRIIDKSLGGSGLDGWALYYETSARVTFSIDGDNNRMPVTLTNGEWYTIGASVSGGASGAYRLFIDGDFQNQLGTGTSFPSTQTNAAIGNWNGDDRNWAGMIDTVLVFNRMLDDGAVRRVGRRLWRPMEEAFLPPSPTVGVAVQVPLHAFTLSAQVPEIATAAVVEVPASTYTLTGQVPTVAAGASAEVPVASYTLTGQVPTVEAGGAVAIDVPLATYTLAAQVPTVAAGASVEVPSASYTLTGQVPTLQVGGIFVDVPVGTYTLAAQVPAVAAGASVAAPTASYTLTGQVPTIETVSPVNVDVPAATYILTPFAPTAGAPIEEFDSTALETDADRLGVMAFDSATLVHAGERYRVILSETDGEVLNAGTDTDGWIECQILSSDVAAGSIAEHDTVIIGGITYRISKIDGLGGDMTLMYLEP